MRIRENHPFRSQLVHVRRQGLRVAFQRASPVIQVINRDEQDIWLSAWLAGVLCFTSLAYHAEQYNRQ